MVYEYNKKEPITFKDIVWKTVLKISEKALIEFRSGQKRTLIHGDWSETYIEADPRKEYIQGVEFLSDLLVGELDEQTIEKLEEINKRVEEKLQEHQADKIDKDQYLNQKVLIMRELFRILMLRLHATGYLKQKLRAG